MTMSKTQYWQKHVDDFSASGLSQTTYCQQQNIKAHNLQYWRKGLLASAEKPKVLIPVVIRRSTQARLMHLFYYCHTLQTRLVQAKTPVS